MVLSFSSFAERRNDANFFLWISQAGTERAGRRPWTELRDGRYQRDDDRLNSRAGGTTRRVRLGIALSVFHGTCRRKTFGPSWLTYGPRFSLLSFLLLKPQSLLLLLFMRAFSLSKENAVGAVTVCNQHTLDLTR
jgi:hypothetical protein